MKRNIVFILLLFLLVIFGVLYSSEGKNNPKQYIILKADDLVFDKTNTISPGWQRFVNYIEEKKIKAGIGIIGNSLEKGDNKYFSLIKDINKRGHIEFWNHGYDHYTNNNRENLISEFLNTPLKQQHEHLLKTQKLGKQKLGITFHTFGAPGNDIDENTIKALEKIDDLKVWLFGKNSSKKYILRRFCEIEYPTHNPDYKRFLKRYDSSREYLTLQVHPNSWDDKRFDEFRQIIEFLIKQKVTFINPFEYYQLIEKKNK